MIVEVLFQTVGLQAHTRTVLQAHTRTVLQAHTCTVLQAHTHTVLQAHTCTVQKNLRLFKEMKLYFMHILKESKGFREGCEIYCGQTSTAYNLETVAKFCVLMARDHQMAAKLMKESAHEAAR